MKKPNPIKFFFDKLSPTYAQKYSPRHPYLHYFFSQRLHLATKGLDLRGKTILDIGAGTGALYDLLKKKDIAFDYYACDISEGMLDNSSIPEEQRFVGEAPQIDWPVEAFDYIFALGLTTYLSAEQMEEHLDFIARKLRPGGRAVISFTNGHSVEIRLRRWLRPLVRRLFKRPGQVITQTFPTRAYGLKEAKHAFMAKNLYYCKKEWLLPSIPFVHHLSPITSVRISRYIGKRKIFAPLLSLLSNEFILSLHVNGTKTENPKTGS